VALAQMTVGVSSFVKHASDGQNLIDTRSPQKQKPGVNRNPFDPTSFLSLISCRLNLTLMARRIENVNPKSHHGL
jgi:hypothetical protein